jgi:hypothetical protein
MINDKKAATSIKAPATTRDLFAAVELHIEELVLHGFASGERFRIGDTVERELARLLSERGVRGLGRDSTAVERLDGGKFKVALGARPQTIGAQLAEALYRRISPNNGQRPASRTTTKNSAKR